MVYLILMFDCLLGADVLNCTWMNEQLNCTTAPGYKFNKIVTNHFSMKIPQISKENRGIYACHVLGARSNGSETCKFISTPEGYTGISTHRYDPLRQLPLIKAAVCTVYYDLIILIFQSLSVFLMDSIL